MSRNIERMRYHNDTLASSLCLAAIALNAVYFVTLYTSQTVVPGYQTGIDIILNILFMLSAFWISEQVKVYSLSWSYGAAALGLVQLARMLWLPEYYHGLEQLTGTPYLIARFGLLLSGLFLLISGVVSFINASELKRFLAKKEAR